ncbi:MAG: hypothetical protein IJW87_05090 [Clostridia bacterium]|nr:hypothetical protein [Clostridia bacterium]
MKKSVKLVSLCLVVTFMFVLLTACVPTMDEVAGEYSGMYGYDGNTYSVGIVLGADGFYASATYKNGSLNSSKSGKYEIEGNKVKLYDSSTGAWTVYQYSDGTLTNNGHKFTKD